MGGGSSEESTTKDVNTELALLQNRPNHEEKPTTLKSQRSSGTFTIIYRK